MVDLQNATDLCERIVREFRPERIILFGSLAYGNSTEDSDIDLLVVMHYAGHSLTAAAEILRRIKPRMPVDLIVRTPEEVQQRLEWNDFFMREVMSKGKVLYEAAHT